MHTVVIAAFWRESTRSRAGNKRIHFELHDPKRSLFTFRLLGARICWIQPTKRPNLFVGRVGIVGAKKKYCSRKSTNLHSRRGKNLLEGCPPALPAQNFWALCGRRATQEATRPVIGINFGLMTSIFRSDPLNVNFRSDSVNSIRFPPPRAAAGRRLTQRRQPRTHAAVSQWPFLPTGSQSGLPYKFKLQQLLQPALALQPLRLPRPACRPRAQFRFIPSWFR